MITTDLVELDQHLLETLVFAANDILPATRVRDGLDNNRRSLYTPIPLNDETRPNWLYDTRVHLSAILCKDYTRGNKTGDWRNVPRVTTYTIEIFDMYLFGQGWVKCAERAAHLSYPQRVRDDIRASASQQHSHPGWPRTRRAYLDPAGALDVGVRKLCAAAGQVDGETGVLCDLVARGHTLEDARDLLRMLVAV